MSSKVRSGLAELLYGKEVQNYMASYNMEYAVESRDYSIGGGDFVFFFVDDDTKTFVSMEITRHCCCEIMHTMQTNTQYHESTVPYYCASESAVTGI
jgi:hypothetical protein